MTEENPFADPKEVNPFATQPTYADQPKAAVDEFNPFADQPRSVQQQPVPQQPVFIPQPTATPATIEPTKAEPLYQTKPLPTSTGNYGSQDDSMRKRQEELERKAEDLERREQELRKLQGTVQKENNFPPFPKFCKIKPCFYHDISLEIPIESQRTCRMMFYVWQLYVFTLLFNFISALAGLCVSAYNGALLFGVSLLYLVIFTPCSFLLWYRPLYKALKSNSSFNFMLFFFVIFFQIVFAILYAMGISQLGTAGWINGASLVDNKEKTVAAMYFITAALFLLLAICMILLLRKDPSVASHTRSNYSGGLDTYNPFDNQPPPRYDQPPVITPTTVAPVQSEPTTFQSQPFQESAYKASPDPAYVKQQAELNKKAADLEKREQQLRQREVQGRVNNFPPLPKFFPLKPCFFHDISLEIPIESQKTCKILFYMWQLYVFTLFFNFITCLSMFCVGADNGGANFGVSLVYLAVFPCLSYVVWYSRIYNALKKDSSFNYMCFFFVTFFKIIFLIIYSLGAFVFGTVGWINAASEIKRSGGSKVVAIMGFVCATLWTLLAAFNFLMLKRVHSAYRRSGASLEKAQGEFTHAVATNKTVQNAAVSSVKAGVSSQVGGGTQY